MDHLAIARQAFALVKPSIHELFKQTARQELHVVIMDPRLKPWDAEFSDAILFQESIRSTDSWEIPFDELARNKAEQAWRGQQANLATQALHPSSLREGDMPFYGSFVYGSVVVGCSGVEQWFDMLISGWIAVAFEQLAIAEMQKT